jgi:hypothetical protein
MKVIVNFGETKVVVPCGTNGDLSIRELIHLATAKYCKLVSVYLVVIGIYAWIQNICIVIFMSSFVLILVFV